MSVALTPTTAALPPLGSEVDRYEVVGEIAQGGMAAVYLVRRHDGHGFDRLLAMKVMLPHLSREQRFVDMFLDEARIAAFVHHPNVVQVFDVGTTRDGLPYMVMEYLRGRSMTGLLQRTWLSDPPTLTRGMLFGIFASVASGLHAAHEATDRSGASLDIVHRDVSPQNIHVSYDGQVRVVDFGIAAAKGRITSTQTGEVKGKVSYLSPEQVNGETATRATDLWALGVIAYETFSRRRLFRGKSDGETLYNIINREVPPLAALDPELPAAVRECVHQCLDRRVFQRPASAAEVARVFERAAAESGGLGAVALREVVQRAFASERGIEDERIAATLRAAPAPLRENTGEFPSVSDSGRPPASRGRRRALPLVALALGLVVVGGAVGWWTQRSASEISSSAEDPAPTVAAAVPAPRTVRVEMGPGVASVLVDGVADPRRPLVVALAEDGARSVVLVDEAGRAHPRTLTAADDGTTLALAPPPSTAEASAAREVTPEPRRRPRRRARRRAPSEASPSSGAPIRPLASPYGEPR